LTIHAPVNPDANDDTKVTDCIGIHQRKGTGDVRGGKNGATSATKED
jgi:hypothetical protein